MTSADQLPLGLVCGISCMDAFEMCVGGGRGQKCNNCIQINHKSWPLQRVQYALINEALVQEYRSSPHLLATLLWCLWPAEQLRVKIWKSSYR